MLRDMCIAIFLAGMPNLSRSRRNKPPGTHEGAQWAASNRGRYCLDRVFDHSRCMPSGPMHNRGIFLPHISLCMHKQKIGRQVPESDEQKPCVSGGAAFDPTRRCTACAQIRQPRRSALRQQGALPTQGRRPRGSRQKSLTVQEEPARQGAPTAPHRGGPPHPPRPPPLGTSATRRPAIRPAAKAPMPSRRKPSRLPSACPRPRSAYSTSW